MKVLAIALNTFREAIRNKLLYAALCFAATTVVGSALFGSVSIGDRTKVIKDFGLFSLSFFGMIICISAGVNLLNKELQQKTIYNILSKPVERWQFVLGKQLGLMLTVSVLLSIMGLALLGFTAFFESRLDPLLLQGTLFAIFEGWIVAALTICFSSLVVTTFLSGVFTFAAYITGRSLSYLQFFLQDETAVGSSSLRFVIWALDWVIPDLGVFNVNSLLVAGVNLSPVYALQAFVYSVSCSALLFVIAAVIFRFRELQ